MNEFLRELTRKTCINFFEFKKNLDRLFDLLNECKDILDEFIEDFSAPDLPRDFPEKLKETRRKLNDVISDVASLYIAFYIHYIAFAIERSKK